MVLKDDDIVDWGEFPPSNGEEYAESKNFYNYVVKTCDALCNLVLFLQYKNVKNTHEEVLHLVKLQALQLY